MVIFPMGRKIYTTEYYKNHYPYSKNKTFYEFQIDMFGNMSIIVLAQIHIMFVHFFGIGSVSSYFH